MVGVQSNPDCPQCGQQAFGKFETKSMTESLFCSHCGFRDWTITLVDHKKQKLNTNPNTICIIKNKDGKWVFRRYTRKGFGAYQVFEKHKGGSMGYLPENKDKREQLINRLVELKKKEPHLDITITIWNEKKREVETIMGDTNDKR